MPAGFLANMRLPNRRGPLPHGSTKLFTVGRSKNKIEIHPSNATVLKSLCIVDEPTGGLKPAPMDVPRIITSDKYENESEHPIPRKSMSSV